MRKEIVTRYEGRVNIKKKNQRMKRSITYLLLVMTVLLGGCSKKPKMGKWTRYESDDKSFAVKMPGQIRKVNKSFPVPEGEVKSRVLECINQEAVFMAGYYLYPRQYLANVRREGNNMFVIAKDAMIEKMDAVQLSYDAGQITKIYGKFQTRTYEWEVTSAESPQQEVYLRQKYIFSPKTRKMYMFQAAVPMESKDAYQEAIMKYFSSYEFHDQLN